MKVLSAASSCDFCERKLLVNCQSVKEHKIALPSPRALDNKGINSHRALIPPRKSYFYRGRFPEHFLSLRSEGQRICYSVILSWALATFGVNLSATVTLDAQG